MRTQSDRRKAHTRGAPLTVMDESSTINTWYERAPDDGFFGPTRLLRLVRRLTPLPPPPPPAAVGVLMECISRADLHGDIRAPSSAAADADGADDADGRPNDDVGEGSAACTAGGTGPGPGPGPLSASARAAAPEAASPSTRWASEPFLSGAPRIDNPGTLREFSSLDASTTRDSCRDHGHGAGNVKYWSLDGA